MDRKKLLIADGDADFRLILERALSPYYQVFGCRTGQEALALLQKAKPQILVLEPLLPGIDGISLLKAAAKEGICPVTLMIGGFFSEYMQLSAGELGVGYLMLKTCEITHIVDRVRDLDSMHSIPQPGPEEEVSRRLLAMGFRAKRRGFPHLVKGIVMMLEQGELPLTKVVYPAIAKERGCRWKAVEKAARGAIEDAWDRRVPELWQECFRVELPECPKTGDFIRGMAQFFRASKE